jgi:hypothetical protein
MKHPALCAECAEELPLAIRRHPPRKNALLAVGLLAILLVTAAPLAWAESDGGWFAGGMLGGGGLGYGGITLALPGAALGHGLAARLSGYYSDYRYFSGATRIDGKDTSGQVIALYQFSGDWGYSNLGAGGQFIDTRLTPVDPGNKRRGSRFDGTLDIDGALYADQWRADWYANYGINQRDYYAQTGVTRAVGLSGWRLGILGGVQGDVHYTRTQAGALIIRAFDTGLELRVSGGATFQSRRGTDGYISVGFSQPF